MCSCFQSLHFIFPQKLWSLKLPMVVQSIGHCRSCLLHIYWDDNKQFLLDTNSEQTPFFCNIVLFCNVNKGGHHSLCGYLLSPQSRHCHWLMSGGTSQNRATLWTNLETVTISDTASCSSTLDRSPCLWESAPTSQSPLCIHPPPGCCQSGKSHAPCLSTSILYREQWQHSVYLLTSPLTVLTMILYH